jgi:hypothetical protein
VPCRGVPHVYVWLVLSSFRLSSANTVLIENLIINGLTCSQHTAGKTRRLGGNA